MSEFIKAKNLSVYDEAEGKGLIRHLMTRVGFKTGEIMVVLVINGKELPFKEQLMSSLTSKVPAVKSIFLNINRMNTNVILGEKNIKIYGNDTISDRIGKFKFNISPLSFFQVNPTQTEVLYAKVLEFAGLARDLMYLGERGYKVMEVQPVDMFPWTGHVETVTLLYYK